MSIYKESKEDLSQAVNELVPGEDMTDKEEELVVNTLEREVDAKAELNKMGDLFEQAEEPSAPARPAAKTMPTPLQRAAAAQARVQEEMAQARAKEEAARKAEEEAAAEAAKEAEEEAEFDGFLDEDDDEIEEENTMDHEEMMNTEVEDVFAQAEQSSSMPDEVSDEVTVITAGTSLTGNMESTGSIEIQGQVNGNVACNGKLTVTGVVRGNSESSEFFADSAKIEGEITTNGTVKIGLGSVVIGNISASSAVIAGAIKGDIDVQGPVVVDTSAVVMGNIKSRSVQINNGAVIEGFCSQCYAEVDVAKIFD